MKVTTISASVRYSRAVGESEFKTIELGAEAILEANENWESAQATLYQELGQQLKNLWTSRANGNVTNQQEHYCHEHQTDFQRKEKDGRVWYAHKQGRAWCNEKC